MIIDSHHFIPSKPEWFFNDNKKAEERSLNISKKSLIRPPRRPVVSMEGGHCHRASHTIVSCTCGCTRPVRGEVRLASDLGQTNERDLRAFLKLFQHTELEHTPKKPLPTGYNGITFIVGQGDSLGCALGVCCIFLEMVSNPFFWAMFIVKTWGRFFQVTPWLA